MSTQKEHKIAIIGLGYVGLPLAVAFSKKFPTTGFDINTQKVQSIQQGNDPTDEVGNDTLQTALNEGLRITTDLSAIKDCNTYIITVPTDINPDKRPVKP